MKLLIDMNRSPRWVETFARSGLHSTHWSTVGRADAPDREVMAFAVASDYVVLTQDLDFGAILAALRKLDRVSCRFVPTMSVRKRSETASSARSGRWQRLCAKEHC